MGAMSLTWNRKDCTSCYSRHWQPEACWRPWKPIRMSAGATKCEGCAWSGKCCCCAQSRGCGPIECPFWSSSSSSAQLDRTCPVVSGIFPFSTGACWIRRCGEKGGAGFFCCVSSSGTASSWTQSGRAATGHQPKVGRRAYARSAMVRSRWSLQNCQESKFLRCCYAEKNCAPFFPLAADRKSLYR